MDINIHDVIRGPVISEKAYKINKQLQRLVLKVHPDANKSLVKKAVERLFNVQVDKVNTITRQGKERMSRRQVIVGKLTKKAIVTLKKGYSVDLFNQANVQVERDQSA